MLLAIAAIVIAGALLIHHYGLQTILNHFGYQITTVQQDETSSQEYQNSVPYNKKLNRKWIKGESSSEPETSSEPEENKELE